MAPETTRVYRLDVEHWVITETIIQGMGHVTGITSDPSSGNIYVVGITMPIHPLGYPGSDDAFYKPYVAVIAPGQTHVQALPLHGSTNEQENNLFLPLSVLWVGPGSGCDRADLNHDGIVNFLDFAEMAAEWVSTDYLKDLRVLAEHWLENCR